MALSWIRLDTNIAFHDKILELLARRNGRAIAFSYICSLTYCGLNGTDGHIPFAALPFVHATRNDMNVLMEVGLLAPNPKGWDVVNYGDRQQLKATTEEITAAQSLGGQKGNCVRHHGPECGCWKKKAKK